jgi:hypothetical protein
MFMICTVISGFESGSCSSLLSVLEIQSIHKAINIIYLISLAASLSMLLYKATDGSKMGNHRGASEDS